MKLISKRKKIQIFDCLIIESFIIDVQPKTFIELFDKNDGSICKKLDSLINFLAD